MMGSNKQGLVAMVLAAGMALPMGGCASPLRVDGGTQAIAAKAGKAAVVSPGVGANAAAGSGSQATATAQASTSAARSAVAPATSVVLLGQNAAQALAEEREMDDYSQFADEEPAARRVFAASDSTGRGGPGGAQGDPGGAQGGPGGAQGGPGGAQGAGQGGPGGPPGGAQGGPGGAQGGGASGGPPAGDPPPPRGSASDAPTASASGEPAAPPRPPRPRPPAAKGKLDPAVLKKVETRHEKGREQAKAREARHPGEAAPLQQAARAAKWVANADGTETQSIETDVTITIGTATSSRHVKLVRTRNTSDRVIISELTDLKTVQANGDALVSHREKTLLADGSHHVAFHREATDKQGKRVADWDKTLSADGIVSGTGTLIWSDPSGKTLKTVTITFTGSEDQLQAEARGADGAATVTLPADGDPKAEARDPKGGPPVPLDIAAGDPPPPPLPNADAPPPPNADAPPPPNPDAPPPVNPDAPPPAKGDGAPQPAPSAAASTIP